MNGIHSLDRPLDFAHAVKLGAMLLVAAVLLEFSQAQAADPNAGTLSPGQFVASHCAACHGSDGNSTNPQFPKLAAQNPEYIAEQLHAFKSGARPSPVMSPLASDLTDEQIDELARYFSDQALKPDGVKEPQLSEIGARIFSEARGGPPCAVCHSPNGFGPGGMMGGRMGMMMGNIGPVPNVFGQHATYIVQQLDAFASDARQGTVMNPIAASLPPQDRKAVAEYLSGLH